MKGIGKILVEQGLWAALQAFPDQETLVFRYWALYLSQKSDMKSTPKVVEEIKEAA